MPYDKSTVTIHASVFNERHTIGDFMYMIAEDIQNGVTDTLYIFNDNEECFNAKSYTRGIGNAIIRPYNVYAVKDKKVLSKPYSHGIPTGTLKHGGYKAFTPHVKRVIDECIQDISHIIEEYKIKHIYYSAAGPGKGDTILGQTIFEINMTIRSYIVDSLRSLSSNPIMYKIEPQNNDSTQK